MPYMPELPYSFEAIVNYNHSVFNIHGIHTSPAGLESTCLVLCYGLGEGIYIIVILLLVMGVILAWKICLNLFYCFMLFQTYFTRE